MFSFQGIKKLFRISVLFSFILISPILIVGYILYTKTSIENESRTEIEEYSTKIQGLLSVTEVYDPQTSTSNENLTDVMVHIDKMLVEKSGESEQIAYKLLKSLIQIRLSTRNTNEELRREGLNSLHALYEYSSNSTDLKLQLAHEMALLFFIYDYVEHNFDHTFINMLPSDVRAFAYAEVDTSTTKLLEKDVLFNTIKLLHSKDKFPNLHRDIVFNTFSRSLVSLYLDSYGTELSEIEATILLQMLPDWNTSIESTTVVACLKRSVCSDIRPSFYEAMTSYFLAERELSQKNNILILEDARKEMMSVSNADQLGKSALMVRIDLFILGAMNRYSVNEKEVEEKIAQINVELKANPEIAGIAQHKLDSWLTPGGEWNRIQQDLFRLAKKSPSLDTFLTNLKLKNYKSESVITEQSH